MAGILALEGERNARAKLEEVDRRLRERHRTASLGNLADPLDELVFIQLSIRTREDACATAFGALRDAVDGDWSRLLSLSDEPLLGALAPGGMSRVKLARIRSQIRAIIDAFGSATLEPLRDLSDAEAEHFLRKLEGVGPKAARCVLMYSLHRHVFPVDSHCLRVLARLGFVSPELDRKAAHDVVQALIPPALRYTLHVNLVHHGRSLCRPLTPECSSCPLVDLCPTGSATRAM